MWSAVAVAGVTLAKIVQVLAPEPQLESTSETAVETARTLARTVSFLEQREDMGHRLFWCLLNCMLKVRVWLLFLVLPAPIAARGAARLIQQSGSRGRIFALAVMIG